MVGSGVDRSWAGSSTSTRQRLEAAGQVPWPSSGTRQVASLLDLIDEFRRGKLYFPLGAACNCGWSSSVPFAAAWSTCVTRGSADGACGEGALRPCSPPRGPRGSLPSSHGTLVQGSEPPQEGVAARR